MVTILHKVWSVEGCHCICLAYRMSLDKFYLRVFPVLCIYQFIVVAHLVVYTPSWCVTTPAWNDREYFWYLALLNNDREQNCRLLICFQGNRCDLNSIFVLLCPVSTVANVENNEIRLKNNAISGHFLLALVSIRLTFMSHYSAFSSVKLFKPLAYAP